MFRVAISGKRYTFAVSEHWPRTWGISLIRAVVLSVVMFMITMTLAFARDPILPNPKLTPGVVLTTDTSKMCQPGCSRTVRHTSGKLKHQVYVECGIDRNACVTRSTISFRLASRARYP